MEPPKVRVSLDAWGTLVLVVVSVIGLHVYWLLDFSGAPATGVLYCGFWAAVATWLAWFYYSLSHTEVSKTGIRCFTFFRQARIAWSQVIRAEVLKNGSLALVTSTQRLVIPLLFFAERDRLSDFIVASVEEVGATRHDEL